MLALSLNFVGAGQAQAACTKLDRELWEGYRTVEPDEELGIEGDGVDGVKTAYNLSSIFQEREYDLELLKLTADWKKRSKSKKLKPKIIKFEKLIKKYIPQPNVFSAYPDLKFLFNDIDYTIKNNAC
jgi:hypothetical protein